MHFVGCRRNALRSNLTRSCPVYVVACDSYAGQELHFPLALVADRLIVPILSVATYLLGMCVPNPSLANAINEKRSPWRIIALLLCTCIARSWSRSAVATIQFAELRRHFAPRLATYKMASVLEKNGGSPFPVFSAPEPNVAVFAIALFQAEVGRSADERSWQNAKRKTLDAAKLRIRNATKNTERPKNTERCQEYGTRILGLSVVVQLRGTNANSPGDIYGVDVMLECGWMGQGRSRWEGKVCGK